MLRKDMDRIESMLDARADFMSCAVREIDRLDIQSRDPMHNPVPARCQLQLPIPQNR